MIPLTADDTRLLKDLRMLVEPVEVYDPSGKLLGRFVPANLERGKALYAKVKANCDPEELKRRMSEQPVGSFSDLVKRLKLMTEESNRRRATGEKDFTLDEARAFLAGEPCKSPASSAT
jgi:hypothetical protein